MATDQCEEYHFQSPFFPGESCEEIYNMNPETHNRSAYYWIPGKSLVERIKLNHLVRKSTTIILW